MTRESWATIQHSARKAEERGLQYFKVPAEVQRLPAMAALDASPLHATEPPSRLSEFTQDLQLTGREHSHVEPFTQSTEEHPCLHF